MTMTGQKQSQIESAQRTVENSPTIERLGYFQIVRLANLNDKRIMNNQGVNTTERGQVVQCWQEANHQAEPSEHFSS